MNVMRFAKTGLSVGAVAMSVGVVGLVNTADAMDVHASQVGQEVDGYTFWDVDSDGEADISVRSSNGCAQTWWDIYEDGDDSPAHVVSEQCAKPGVVAREAAKVVADR